LAAKFGCQKILELPKQMEDIRWIRRLESNDLQIHFYFMFYVLVVSFKSIVNQLFNLAILLKCFCLKTELKNN
jgi:hypothetical protein